MRYDLSSIAQICGATHVGCNVTIDSVVIDSRSFTIDAATLFAAIRTESRDGHNFLKGAYAKGCRAFLVEQLPVGVELPDAGFVVARSTTEALQSLAAEYRSHFAGRVVAVTGSAGKTVVKEWVAEAAPEGMKVYRSPKSYNSQIGVPLSLLMMPADADVAVIEAGISKRGEMERLRDVIRPDVGVFTVLGAAHDENFGSRSEKLAEKMKLFTECRTIIYNSAEEGVEQALREVCPIDARLIDARSYEGVCRVEGGRVATENAASVVALYDVLGVAAETTLRTLGQQPSSTKLEIKDGIYSSLIVSDTFSGDVNTFEPAVDYLRRVSADRPRVIVLSDIPVAEPQDEQKVYERIAERIGQADIRLVVCVGQRIVRYAELLRCAGCEVKVYLTADEMLRRLSADDVEGCAVLVRVADHSDQNRITHTLQRQSHTTTLEVELDSMIRNLKIYRSHLGAGVRLTAMVKAASYGHGRCEIAQTLQQQGVDYLAVAFADEGVELRRGGITMPIVVLNADADSFELMVAHNLEPEIYNFRSLSDFARVAKVAGRTEYPIHLKIDSGMHRLGFRSEDFDELVAMLREMSDVVRVSSVFSHLCVADDPSQDDFTRAQIEYFDSLSSRISEAVGGGVIRHICNTAGMIRFPYAQFDMCRLGIGLYGFGDEVEGLRPIASLRTRIVRIAHLKAGETVGYGRRGVLHRDSVIATIPIGYADGLDRHLSCGGWSMLVEGGKAPIVGRVCMDSCMIDITDIPEAAEGSEVTVFSAVPGNTAEDMARVLDTISYEILTSVSGRVKRIYTKE
ncbi:MAG: alanine racemase [Rikenellaceae bacterium]|nr:alanine racemase [Rikenellaceae bacterium]